MHINTTTHTIFPATEFVVTVLNAHIVLSTFVRAVRACALLWVDHSYEPRTKHFLVALTLHPHAILLWLVRLAALA